MAATLFGGRIARAQEPGPGPEPGPEPEMQGEGTSAGGKWMVFESEDKMTAAKLVRFELESDNTLPDSDRHSKVILYCRNGKLELSDFHPNLRMAGPNRPGFWGQPQMEVTVRRQLPSGRALLFLIGGFSSRERQYFRAMWPLEKRTSLMQLAIPG